MTPLTSSHAPDPARPRCGPILSAGAAVAALLCLAAAAPADDGARPGVTHALLINGGSKPESNYLSHLHHLEDMVALLERRGLPPGRIHIFSADGEDKAADLAARDALPARFWLVAGTRIGGRLRPRTELTDSRWEGRTIRPARRGALLEWFNAARQDFAPGDRLLLFVTDHGTGNPKDADNGAISLWEEELSVQDLKELLALLPRGMSTVMVMSQCFSGTFANAMFDDGAAEPSGGVCGFFSTARDLPAYGCYPEGRDRDRIGHAFHFIDALDRQATAAGAHLEVLVTDDTPDVPLRTSDAYLERLVAAEASSRAMAAGEFADRLLERAWGDRAAWEPQIRLLDRLGAAYGTFSPRSLAELEAYDGELPKLIERMETYAGRWRGALVSVKEEALADFLGERPEWNEQLEDRALEGLGAGARGELLAQLLPQLEQHARGRPGIWDRLESLRRRAQGASEAAWRLEVRRAALRRMRAVLVGIAGRVHLDREPAADETPPGIAARRRALSRLEECEALEPGALPASIVATGGPAVRPYPPLADEIRLMEEILPSWLGVTFGPVSDALRAGREVPPGAGWLQAVFPDSPAMAAGLEAGDVILGPPGRPFSFPGQLREWTMISPRDTPLRLAVLRPGARPDEDLAIEATLSLRPFPLEWPKLPGPPQVGDLAPALPADLAPVGRRSLKEPDGREHLLFFWATWCLPCKAAVPEVLAFAAARRIRVVAITDEDPTVVAPFLEKRREPFFKHVAADPRRRSYISYGVSGTPTIILVDREGVVRHRQVGYSPEHGLTIEGWRWSAP